LEWRGYLGPQPDGFMASSRLQPRASDPMEIREQNTLPPPAPLPATPVRPSVLLDAGADKGPEAAKSSVLGSPAKRDHETKEYSFGSAGPSDVELRLEDGTVFRAHREVLHVYVPWFATYFQTPVGAETGSSATSGKVVELHDDVARGWYLLLQRCYPPNTPVQGYKDAMLLVPLVDKYCVDWLRDELRDCLLAPMNPGLGPAIRLGEGARVGWELGPGGLANDSTRLRLSLFQPGVRVLGQRLWEAGDDVETPVFVGRLEKRYTEEHRAYLTCLWDGFGEMDLELNEEESGFAIWLAAYQGCPVDAECCWRHGFEAVVRGWFNVREVVARQQTENVTKLKYDDLSGSQLALHHYIREATSVEVLRLASSALELHFLEARGASQKGL